MSMDDLKQAVRALEKRAAPHGSMHPLWDLIFTGRAILSGSEGPESYWPFANREEAKQEILDEAAKR